MDLHEIFGVFSCFKPLGIIVLFRLLPIILQGNSTFGSEWINEPICDSLNPKPVCCNNHTCGGQYQLQDINEVYFGVQVVSFVLLLLPLICCDCCAYCRNNNEDIYACGVALLVIQMIAGVLSLFCCIVLAAKSSGSFSYGSSFYQCLLGSIYCFCLSLACICCCISTNFWGNQPRKYYYENA